MKKKDRNYWTKKMKEERKEFRTKITNQRLIQRKFKNGNFKTIKTNDDFTTFYNELENYFKCHKFDTSLEIINDRYFTMSNNITKCEAILIYHPNICKIEFLPSKSKNSIELYKLEMYNTGQGLGTIFMDIFKMISRKTNIEILLMPGFPGDSSHLTDIERNNHIIKVRNFYHKNGFKRKGLKNKYWSNVYQK